MASINNNEILISIDYCKENKVFDELESIYRSLPSGKCNGCGNCCMESVGINLVEFINIYNYLKKNEELRKKSLAKILDYYFTEYTQKKSCPFKDEDNRCLVYEVRPLNCRLFGHWLKEDYNKNLNNIKDRNREYKKIIKDEYDLDICDEVVNYRIEYCEEFKPEKKYLTKEERLEFSDSIMILDSKILSKGIIDIDFKDRGIVEYFIESLLEENISYNIKIKISKDEKIRNTAIKRLNKLLIK